ncbi:MAG TPA: TolC family protein, partial [Sphingorhabdus sp.]|nr:TolC family protein [Sphingorhabdus sp.]
MVHTGMRRLGALPIWATAIAIAAPASAQDYLDPLAARLPDANPAPLAVTLDDDPILTIATSLADEAAFHEVIRQALRASPNLAEGRADGAAALAAKRAAESLQYPRIDFTITGNKAIDREYSNDPDNILERLRGGGRADASANVEQVLVDFGASSRRIDAAIERIGAAEAEYDRKSENIALRAIASWYDLFAYGHLSELAENFIVQNEELRGSVELRISQGVAAPVERARIDSAIANAKLRLAQYRRELANAQARFVELFELEAPKRIARAPAPELERLSADALSARAGSSSPVRVAEANAKAARADADAARADTQPNITAAVDAGKFGLYE